MNNAKYSKKFDVFIMDKDEEFQISTYDIFASKRLIAGLAVISVVFGWESDENPLYKIKKDTINKQ